MCTHRMDSSNKLGSPFIVAMKTDSSRPHDSSTPPQALLAEIQRLRQELTQANLNSKVSTDQYGWLFRNMPLGVLEEDYSPIKIENR